VIEPEIIEGLKKRHKNIFPLLFQRSVEHAETTGELFDILEDLPRYPVMWSEEKRKWVHVSDVTLSHRINLLKGS
jgi:type II secretory pathway component PulF